MGKPRCNHCGGEYGAGVTEHFLHRAFTLGLCGAAKGDYRPFCSRDCRAEHQAQQNRRASTQRQQTEERKRSEQQKSSDKQRDKAQAFRELVVGRDIISFKGECLDCGDVLIHPEAGDECPKCGSDRKLELRLYGDGHKRIACHCKTCGHAPVLQGVPCDCGGEARIGGVVVRSFQNPKKNNPDDPIVESKGVVFSRPRDIQAKDLKIDVTKQKKSGGEKRTNVVLRWTGYILLFLSLIPVIAERGIIPYGLELFVSGVGVWIFVKFLRLLPSQELRQIIFVGVFVWAFWNAATVSPTSSTNEADTEETLE